jgi:hypothetical protein
MNATKTQKIASIASTLVSLSAFGEKLNTLFPSVKLDEICAFDPSKQKSFSQPSKKDEKGISNLVFLLSDEDENQTIKQDLLILPFLIAQDGKLVYNEVYGKGASKLNFEDAKAYADKKDYNLLNSPLDFDLFADLKGAFKSVLGEKAIKKAVSDTSSLDKLILSLTTSVTLFEQMCSMQANKEEEFVEMFLPQMITIYRNNSYKKANKDLWKLLQGILDTYTLPQGILWESFFELVKAEYTLEMLIAQGDEDCISFSAQSNSIDVE